jgi:GTP-binding protein
MNISTIEFTCSSPSLKQCPAGEVPEFAFIGRSNVGKSSLINMLAGKKGLAKVSGTPGKTRLINHFRVISSGTNYQVSSIPSRQGGISASLRHPTSRTWYLVDLPGYGFARLSKQERARHDTMIHSYLLNRENLALTLLLIDSRHEPQRIDLEFMNWLGDNGIGFVILFTKADKLTRTGLEQNLEAYRKALSVYWSEFPAMFPTSARTGLGRDQVLSVIDEALLQINEGE